MTEILTTKMILQKNVRLEIKEYIQPLNLGHLSFQQSLPKGRVKFSEYGRGQDKRQTHFFHYFYRNFYSKE